MTPAVLIPASLPDLRGVPLGELPGSAALDEVVQRVLPGSRKPLASEAGFSSAL